MTMRHNNELQPTATLAFSNQFPALTPSDSVRGRATVFAHAPPASPGSHCLRLGALNFVPAFSMLRHFSFAVICSLTFALARDRASGRDYEIPEIGASLALSGIWIPVKASLVQSYNDDMLRFRPQTRSRYVAGFTRGAPKDGSDTGSSFIWIQSAPMPKTSITPEQFATIFPGIMSKNKAQMERSLSDRVASVDPGAAHYELRLDAVVYDSSPTLPDGSIGRIRAFVIMTKTSMISISAYSTSAEAQTAFEEVRGIVSTLSLKGDQKMPPTWINRLKQLLGQ